MSESEEEYSSSNKRRRDSDIEEDNDHNDGKCQRFISLSQLFEEEDENDNDSDMEDALRLPEDLLNISASDKKELYNFKLAHSEVILRRRH